MTTTSGEATSNSTTTKPSNHTARSAGKAHLRQPVAPYDTTQLATVRVPPGFAGTVVLWEIPAPPNTPPPFGSGPTWFWRMLTVTARAGTAAFLPGDPDVILIDYTEGFDPTPAALHAFCRQYLDLRYGGPIPEGPPVVG